MSPKRSYRRRLAVGVVLGYCALTAPAVLAETVSGIPSLSGYVYLETSGNGGLDIWDWAIPNATVLLLKETDPSFVLSVTTDAHGRYLFDGLVPGWHTGLTPGVYTIKLATPSSSHGVDTVGTLWSFSTGLEIQPQSLAGTAHNNDGQRDSFTGVTVTADTVGADYNFGEASYPVSLLSLAMFVTTCEPVQHYTLPTSPPVPPPSNPIPEPGTALLLGMACLCLGAVAVSRRGRACC
jgi:hypothetical protein